MCVFLSPKNVPKTKAKRDYSKDQCETFVLSTPLPFPLGHTKSLSFSLLCPSFSSSSQLLYYNLVPRYTFLQSNGAQSPCLLLEQSCCNIVALGISAHIFPRSGLVWSEPMNKVTHTRKLVQNHWDFHHLLKRHSLTSPQADLEH
jgi:hypothetical protein